jgi:chromosome segregation ATPase
MSKIETPVSIQERTKNKTNEIIAEIEGHFDDYIMSWRESKLYKTLHSLGVKRAHTKDIIEHSNTRIKEYQDVLDSTDEQIKEGYSNFSKPQVRKVIKWWEGVIESCNEIAEEAKTIRKYNTVRNKKLREAGLLDNKKKV